MNCRPVQNAACGLDDPTLPSRYDNPFATCWTRPGALPFRFPTGQSAEQLVARLAAQNWHGAIVGPHGSGKSTLLETLKPVLRAAGCEFGEACRTVVIVDGYEQLGWFERLRLTRRCRRKNFGLLVTSHAIPIGIPLLVRLAPNRDVVQRLVADLAAQVSTPITAADVAASHACHGSNVREILFDLYDRHERLRRAARSGGFGGA
jgi:energy-coupling factor transporter ATP-binding protein EcfA2